MLTTIRALQDFRKALAEQDIKLAKIAYVLGDLGYALRELKRFFRSRKAGRAADMNDKDACIFAYFVEARVEELREIAEEIDKAASE